MRSSGSRKNILLFLLASAAAALAAAAAAVWEVYCYSLARRGSRIVTAIRGETKGHEEDFYTWRENRKKAFIASPQIRMSISSDRGEPLAGFYSPCEGSDGSRIAFVIHGYRSEHAETAGMLLDYYHSRGFDVFSPDNTAHGESGGKYISFDLFESEDALKWIEYLKKRAGKDIQIVLHGFSLGGATVMKMSDKVGEEVRFIVEDSGYTKAETQFQPASLYRMLRFVQRLVTGTDLADTDVRPNLARASVPVLFVQGTDDMLVPSENAPALYEFYQGPKDKLILPGTRHIEGMYTAPEEYAAKIDEMIEKYIQ